MASLNYDSFFLDLANGAVVPGTDTFYAMLVTASYTPNKGTHTKRSDVTAGEVSGAGYTAGGKATTCTVAMNTTTHKLTLTFSAVSWPNATITAATGCVIYKRRGGAASADELVAYVDNGGAFTSTNGTFTQSFTSPVEIDNG